MPTAAEMLWLRSRIIRMRALLRFAKDSRVEAGLRELIGEGEARLERLEEQARVEGWIESEASLRRLIL